MKKKLSRDEWFKMLIDNQFRIAGYDMTYNDLLQLPEEMQKTWFQDYCFKTIEQYKEWKQFFIEHYCDHYKRCNKHVKEKAFSWFNLQYGLAYDFDINLLIHEK